MSGDYELFLAVGAALFVLGALGFLTRRNLILIMLSAEMMLHGISLTLVTFGRRHGTLEGQVFTIFILTIAACEAALALVLILALYQKSKSLDIVEWTELREPDLPKPEFEEDRLPPPEPEPLHFPTLPPAGLPPHLDGEEVVASGQPEPVLAAAHSDPSGGSRPRVGELREEVAPSTADRSAGT